MIRIANFKIPLQKDCDNLVMEIAHFLDIKSKDIKSYTIIKRSIDARKKDNIIIIYTLDIELFINEKTIKNKNIIQIPKSKYQFPFKTSLLKKRPVVVGFGPAGMFAALELAYAGANPLVIEMGRKVDDRKKDVTDFWNNGNLIPFSNVQFGEGGAGTFSDGKLTTGVKDKRVPHILKLMVEAGAPEEIMYESKPHVGTDYLHIMVKNIREKIISLGGEFLFKTMLSDLIIENNKITGVKIKSSDSSKSQEEKILKTDNVILSIGHSSRDTFEMLYKNKVLIEPKSFSIGVRIEHKREDINKAQYGRYFCNERLGAADYKLSAHLTNGRGVYTFCMCPGGVVVAAASEKDTVVTNGMSYFKRDKENSNSAVLVGVTPNDFESDSPLAGVALQRKIENAMFEAGGRNYYAPVQLVSDFLASKKSTRLGTVTPSYKPGYNFCDFNEILPDWMCESLKLGIRALGQRLKGFSSDDAVLTGAETRSSSPIRIVRDDTLQSNIKGLYPCGEGAGYAGGIMSASIDGIKCAEAVLS